MAIANILAIGTTAADSADQAFSAITTVGLKKTSGGTVDKRARVNVFLKDDLGGYNKVGQLNGNVPIQTFPPGTYRFSRLANGASVGVFAGA